MGRKMEGPDWGGTRRPFLTSITCPLCPRDGGPSSAESGSEVMPQQVLLWMRSNI